jgi:hypothetical protein
MPDQPLLLTQLKRLFPWDSPKGEPMILNKSIPVIESSAIPVLQ